MKTKQCPHCYTEIDARSFRCPYCGNYTTKKLKVPFWIFILLIIAASFIYAQYQNLIIEPRKEKEKQAAALESNMSQVSWPFNKDSIRDIFNNAEASQRGQIIDDLVAYMAPFLDSIKKAEDARIEAEKIESDIKSLELELSLIKDFNVLRNASSLSSINYSVSQFKEWLKTADDCQRSNNNEIRKLGQQMRPLVKSLQIRAFPVLRKEYGKLLDKELWDADIDVAVFGSGNRTIQFVGGVFASNMNIKEFQTRLRETMFDLRFKRANYKWYSEASEYDYYTMDSPADGD